MVRGKYCLGGSNYRTPPACPPRCKRLIPLPTTSCNIVPPNRLPLPTRLSITPSSPIGRGRCCPQPSNYRYYHAPERHNCRSLGSELSVDSEAGTTEVDNTDSIGANGSRKCCLEPSNYPMRLRCELPRPSTCWNVVSRWKPEPVKSTILNPSEPIGPRKVLSWTVQLPIASTP